MGGLVILVSCFAVLGLSIGQKSMNAILKDSIPENPTWFYVFGHYGLTWGGGATSENFVGTSFKPCVYRHEIEKNEIDKGD